jgi:hypothetical protein
MSCPYLTTVTMVFCRLSPVRVYVPTDRVTTASRCEGNCFDGCPVYREAVEGARSEIRSYQTETNHAANEAPKGAVR